MIVQVCAFFKKTQQEHDVKNMAILRRFIVIEKLKMYVTMETSGVVWRFD